MVSSNRHGGIIAVYPRCIRLALGEANLETVETFEKEIQQELDEGDALCALNGDVWLGDVRLGAFPIITPEGQRLILMERSADSLVCHELRGDSSKKPKIARVSSANVTNTLIQMFFVNFKATVWRWAEECMRKITGLPKGSISVGWKQALFGQGLEGEKWAKSKDRIHVWNLLRKNVLTEIWWLYNRSLAEDTSSVTACYLVQQIWLSVRLYIILEWIQVVKQKDEQMAKKFDKRWLSNGFAGMRTRSWVLWMWEEPLCISKLNI